jgi:hypothetical protein
MDEIDVKFFESLSWHLDRSKAFLSSELGQKADRAKDFWRGDKSYKGSGWGHGLRQEVAKRLDLDNKASSVAEVGLLSQLQFSEVEIVGQALEKIKNDPELVKTDDLLVKKIKLDARYGKEAFTESKPISIEFGGKRAPQNMMDQMKNPFNPKYVNTWKVAVNELTWLIRHANVNFVVVVDVKGGIVINHTLSDVFDLRSGKGHTAAYNRVTDILGPLYHDFVGGNDHLKIKAKWTTKK